MLDLHLILDMTGSMASVSRLLSRQCSELAERLEEALPGARMTVTGIGNYAAGTLNKDYGPLVPLQEKVTELKTFLNDTHGIRGGMSRGFKGNSCSAAYEVGLQTSNSLAWRSDVARVVLVIGDEEPTDTRFGIHYLDEVRKLEEKKVMVYGVQCLNVSRNSWFYKEIASVTGGYHLKLQQFADILELVIAVAYKQKDDDSLENFAQELKNKARMSRAMLSIFNTLGGNTLTDRLQVNFTDYSSMSGDLVPVDPARFQVLDVPQNQDIKSFVISTGAAFRVGRGFYELTKNELIQRNKEVVLVERSSGDMWSGPQARDMIGLPLGQEGNISPRSLGSSFMNKYVVYVQSTSNNRKLIGNTKFLYEAERKLATV